MFRFTIRDVLWLTVVVAMGCAWCIVTIYGAGTATTWLCDYVWGIAADACMRLEGRAGVSLQ